MTSSWWCQLWHARAVVMTASGVVGGGGTVCTSTIALRWRHNKHDGVSNHQPHDCLLNRLFRRRSKQASKLRVTGLCVGNSPGTGEFPAQRVSYAENVSIWWRHHGVMVILDHNDSPRAAKGGRVGFVTAISFSVLGLMLIGITVML